MSLLLEASERRREVALDDAVERAAGRIVTLADASAASGGAVKEYQTVTPEARKKLHGIIAHYAHAAHPFRSCTRDNMKRFGPGRVERVCAVVKDLGRNTTMWRGHPERDIPSPEYALSDDMVELIESVGVDQVRAIVVEELADLMEVAE